MTAATTDLVLAELQERLNDLESAFKNEEARDCLLDLARNFLAHALSYSAAGGDAKTQIALLVVRSHVEQAETMLERYGPNLTIVGGGT